ncbi:hypothetical protein AWH48_12200 [Domibacillus aminovorans]|uniref:Uncharacterized protein n=1 Tax=Domibacillus aminovorans TaxID=29332 RepID=A0A177KKK4_9BACI|nr:hypothetical protein [Domibacillus aminovorans]OAH53111.1 hypothetical protein AWH48_12200 [Domibacillus aminovorans]
MCKLCGGTHRVAYEGAIGRLVKACPTCGPVPEHIRKARRELLDKKIAEAEKKLLGGDAA